MQNLKAGTGHRVKQLLGKNERTAWVIIRQTSQNTQKVLLQLIMLVTAQRKLLTVVSRLVQCENKVSCQMHQQYLCGLCWWTHQLLIATRDVKWKECLVEAGQTDTELVDRQETFWADSWQRRWKLRTKWGVRMLFLPPLQLDISSSRREDELDAASETRDGGAFASLLGGGAYQR